MPKFICDKEYPVVATEKGKIRGFVYDGVFTFYGIRYARARRFQMPEEIPAWEGIKDALGYGYICPVLSTSQPSMEVLMTHRFWPENENCQYLNIWTPTIEAGAKKPVIVWLHGGGYSAGSSIEQANYDGHNMAVKEDCITVTVNHRLNAFGFLDVSDYGEKYWNSRNVGMADLVAALEWIKKNIAGFGGDPDCVTIMGQSGGGGKVTTLGQIPAAAGLFQRQMVMSGAMGGKTVPNPKAAQPKEIVEAILKAAKLETVDELAVLPATLFIRAVNQAVYDLYQDGEKTVSWGPKPNDYYLGNPFDVGFCDHAKKAPTLIGSVVSEMGFAPLPKDVAKMSEEEQLELVKEKFGDNTDKVVELFKKAYPGRAIAHVLNVDTMMRPGHTSYAKQKASEAEANVYNYLFTVEFPYEGGKCAWHCSDIPFWFGSCDTQPIDDFEGSAALEDVMRHTLATFARTGDPNNDKLPTWNPTTPDCAKTMIFDTEGCCEKPEFDTELIECLKQVAPARPFGFGAPQKPDTESDRAWMY
ncbi:MAG: carboxylesterase/lipase family protein [Lachnospiraceae bacterium]|nr:carboxylesterase/lipase family protein [Lachnospiraceae bacterium]